MSKSIEFSPLDRGRMFSVPLCETGGYGYGYIVIYRSGFGYLSNIFDYVGDQPSPRQDFGETSLILRDILHNHAQFIKSKHHILPWIVLENYIANPLPAKEKQFLVGRSIYDTETGEKIPAQSGDEKKYRKQIYDLGNKDSMMIEAALRRRQLVFDDSKKKFVLT